MYRVYYVCVCVQCGNKVRIYTYIALCMNQYLYCVLFSMRDFRVSEPSYR